MRNTLQNIWADIKQHKNLELYVILAVNFTILILGSFEQVPDLFMHNFLLVPLSILLFGLLITRQKEDKMQQKIVGIQQEIAKNSDVVKSITDHLETVSPQNRLHLENITQNLSMDSTDFRTLNTDVNEFFIAAASVPTEIVSNPKWFHRELSKRSKTRIILPSVDILKRTYTSNQNYESEKYIARLNKTIVGLELLRGWLEDGSKLEVRTIAVDPVASVFMSNPNFDDGLILYVPFLYGDFSYSRFRQADRPAVIISKVRDPLWFDNFYYRYYEGMWNAAEDETTEKLKSMISDLRTQVRKTERSLK